MPYDLKRYLRICLFLFTFGFVFYAAFEVYGGNASKLLPVIAYPTALFVPIAYLVVKFKLHSRTSMSKYSVIAGLTGMGIGGILAKMISHEYLGHTTVLGIEITLLFYVLLLREYGTNKQLDEIGFKPISASHFKKTIATHHFPYIFSWLSPATKDHYFGNFKGIDTCIMSFVTTNSAYLAVIFLSHNWCLPNFSIKPKGFFTQTRDMLNSNKYDSLLPQSLVDKFEVSADDNAAFATTFTSDVNGYLLGCDSVVLEGGNDGLFIYMVEKFKDMPENYSIALNQAYECVRLMGIDKKQSENVQPSATDGLR